MANWTTQSTISSFNPEEARINLVDGRARGETSGTTVGLNTGGFQQTTADHTSIDPSAYAVTGYDIVGINGGQIENMRQTIREYVQRVQTKVDTTLNSSLEQARNAFRGEDAIAAVNSYIDKIKSYCMNMTSSLLGFSDKLADAGNAWITAQANIASNVTASTGAFSEGTAYTETVQYNGATQ